MDESGTSSTVSKDEIKLAMKQMEEPTIMSLASCFDLTYNRMRDLLILYDLLTSKMQVRNQESNYSRSYLENFMKKNSHMTKAMMAKELGIARTTFYKYLDDYDLEKPSYTLEDFRKRVPIVNDIMGLVDDNPKITVSEIAESLGKDKKIIQVYVRRYELPVNKG